MAQPIAPRQDSIAAAATPANTPLNVAPISRGEGLPKPSVATVEEDDDDEDGDELEGGNPASMLARVSLWFHIDICVRGYAAANCALSTRTLLPRRRY